MGFGRILASIIGFPAAFAVHRTVLKTRCAAARFPRDLAGYAGLLIVLAPTCPLRTYIFDRQALRAAGSIAEGLDLVMNGPGPI
jgi:hypothetical protein